MRFSYDSTKLQPSNLLTNEITTDETEYFKFEDEFKDSLEFFTIPYDGTGDGIRAVVSFDPPVTATEHIIDKEGIGKVVNTDGGVLLGKMSFQMTTDERFKTDWFSLVENLDSSPETGIKININGKQHFEAQSTFRFTDGEISADLSSLIASRGEKNEENPENATYKEYTLTPTFDGETTSYQTEILEYVDDIDITATPTDEAATMKIKVPKRDENNNLMYEADGVTPQYEEKDLQNGVPLNVKLNKLGAEPDTVIKVIVTAIDGVTTKEYELVVKRPYATIKGQATLADYDNEEKVQDILDNYGVQVNNRVDINLYKPDLAEWESISDIYHVIYDDPFTYEKLEQIQKEMNAMSNDDGTYEVYVIPGKYDVQVTRLGYLDYIYSDVELNAGDILDMGQFKLIPGDANRDGVIYQEDINKIKQVMKMDKSDPAFSEAYNPSQIGEVSQEDLNYAKQNQNKELQIVYFKR